MNNLVKETVKEYYGKTLTKSSDLKTNACCTDTALPAYLKAILSGIHPEVLARYYGCGLVLPDVLEGQRVLDLGCGAGRDVYTLSRLVGEDGFVVGIDMTEKQLEVAKNHIEYHTQHYGFKKPNVAFVMGYIEELTALGLDESSFDIMVSNCVINLSPDKNAVLRGVYSLLKPGGEFYFSDVYADRRLPPSLKDDPILYGECLSGALYQSDFLDLAKRCGFTDPRLVETRPLTIENTELEARLGNNRFVSATYRLFKLDHLDTQPEDYGQAVCYRGTFPHAQDRFMFDHDYTFEKGRTVPVCRNTYRLLKETRFSSGFHFYGQETTHFGKFTRTTTDNPFSRTPTHKKENSCC